MQPRKNASFCCGFCMIFLVILVILSSTGVCSGANTSVNKTTVQPVPTPLTLLGGGSTFSSTMTENSTLGGIVYDEYGHVIDTDKNTTFSLLTNTESRKTIYP